MSLTDQLRRLGDQLRKKIPDDQYEVIASATRDLSNSGLTATAVREGDIAPDFTLPDAFGDPVSLNEILNNGPAVISFYRGGW